MSEKRSREESDPEDELDLRKQYEKSLQKKTENSQHQFKEQKMEEDEPESKKQKLEQNEKEDSKKERKESEKQRKNRIQREKERERERRELQREIDEESSGERIKKIGQFSEFLSPDHLKNESNSNKEGTEKNISHILEAKRKIQDPLESIENVTGEEDPDPEYEDDLSGVPLEPFNLKEEREQGVFFASDQRRVRRGEEGEVSDPWLDSMETTYKKKEIKPKKKNQEEKDLLPEKDLKYRIIELLRERETVLQALRRLKPSHSSDGKGNRNTTISKSSKNKKEEQKQQPPPQQQEGDLTSFTLLTEAADDLLNLYGYYNIYSDNRENILRSLSMDQNKKESKPFSNNTMMYEYKWSRNEDAETYGPFTGSVMKNWLEQGFFRNELWVRETEPESSQSNPLKYNPNPRKNEWKPIIQFSFE